jgi:hypothetical protein
MDNIRYSQIVSVIDALTRVISIDAIKIKERLEKYNTMSDKEVIKDLSMFIYNNFKNEPELYEYFLSLIRNINPKVAPSVEYMKSELSKMYLNENESMDVKTNNKLATNTLQYVANLFNSEAIDYVVVGALPCFLSCGIPLFRYHDDIDIMINEEDLDTVRSLMEESGFIFSDYRFPNLDEFYYLKDNKPSHQIMAQSQYNDFHIGFFTFRREKDNSITTTEYMQREGNGEVIVDRLERSYSKVGTDLRFNNEFKLGGVKVKSCSLEHVYNIKCTTKRPKDITDMEKLESYIDKDKLKELRRNTNTKQIVKDVEEDKMTI